MTEIQKQQLLLPFPASDIEWRTAYNSGDKTKGFAVPFVNSRAIQERLDEIFGPENWQNEFTVAPSAEGNFRLQPRKKRMDKKIRRFGSYGY